MAHFSKVPTPPFTTATLLERNAKPNISQNATYHSKSTSNLFSNRFPSPTVSTLSSNPNTRIATLKTPEPKIYAIQTPESKKRTTQTPESKTGISSFYPTRGYPVPVELNVNSDNIQSTFRALNIDPELPTSPNGACQRCISIHRREMFTVLGSPRDIMSVSAENHCSCVLTQIRNYGESPNNFPNWHISGDPRHQVIDASSSDTILSKMEKNGIPITSEHKKHASEKFFSGKKTIDYWRFRNVCTVVGLRQLLKAGKIPPPKMYEWLIQRRPATDEIYTMFGLVYLRASDLDKATLEENHPSFMKLFRRFIYNSQLKNKSTNRLPPSVRGAN
jgi:hypothetical protein